jgi:prepilin-type N-terminal cleavage/methylation domain-containing protein
MIFRRTGFTLVELMIVVAIVSIIAAAIYPAMSGYYARGRDVGRISDIKDISARFQEYTRTNSIYPSNISKDGDTSYCVSTIRGWVDAVAGFRDKQFSQLGGTGALHSDPALSNTSI